MSDSKGNLSPTIALVPAWDSPLDGRPGLFALADGSHIPGGWDPNPRHYDPKAIPTPFARAEAMRLVLAKLDIAEDHPLASKFRLLLLGVCAGLLELEAADLTSDVYDNFGRALSLVDADSRYFCHVRFDAGGRARTFGITHRESLFSPHARRGPEEWDELREAIQPFRPRTLTLLADWREALSRAGRWSPEEDHCEWQRGVNRLLEGVSAEADLALLRDHARFVGPVWLWLPTGRNELPVRQEPVFLPSYSEGYAASFVKNCQYAPKLTAEGVLFQDTNGRSIARIRLPAPTGNSDPLALGMGLVDLVDTHRTPPTSPELWITAHGSDPGLVDLMKPVELALTQNGRPVDAVHVKACPVLYPDPIRILFDRGLWPGPGGGARTLFSARLTTALLAGGGSVPDDARIDTDGGGVAELGTGERKVRLVFLDRFAGLDVLDLRALGFVLWTVFVGEAEMSSALQGQLAMSDNLEKLMHDTEKRPFEPREWVYERVGGSPDAPLAGRLATQQRFLKTYRNAGEGLPQILERAARSFVEWASGRKDVVPLGRASIRFVALRLTTGEEIRLARDAVES